MGEVRTRARSSPAPGWPLAAVLVAFALNEPLRRLGRFLAERLTRLETKWGGIGVTAHLTGAELDTRLCNRGLPGKDQDHVYEPEGKDADWTRRCGNVYWLGHNLVHAALAASEGNLFVAWDELSHAIHHGKQVGLNPEWIDRLVQVQQLNLSDQSGRVCFIQTLLAASIGVGRCIQSSQPDYALRDVVR